MVEVVFIAFVLFCAHFCGTIIGFGSSMIMEPVLFLSVAEPASFLLSAILHCTSGMYKAFLFRANIVWSIVVSFAIPAVCAAIVGAYTLIEIRPSFFGHLLGVFLIGYVVFSCMYPHLVIPNTCLTNVIGGMVSGFLAGLFGIRGAIQAAFLSGYQLKEEAYIGTSAAIALIVDIVRLSVYIAGGMRLTHELMPYLMLFIPVAMLGVKAAHVCVPYIPQTYFRSIVAGSLLIVGLLLAAGFYELVA